MSLTVGVDVGGTKIAGGLVDDDGTGPRASSARVARHRRRPRSCDAIADLVAKLAAATTTVEAVGVAAAGFVDKARATVALRAQPRLARRAAQGRARGARRPARSCRERRQRRGLGRVHVRRRRGRRGPAAAHHRHRRRRRRRPRRRALPRRRSASAPRSATSGWCPDGILCGCGNHGCFESYARGTRTGARRARGRAGRRRRWRRTLLDAGRRRRRRGSPADDHRGRAARATRSRSSGSPSSATGSARASPR